MKYLYGIGRSQPMRLHILKVEFRMFKFINYWWITYLYASVALKLSCIYKSSTGWKCWYFLSLTSVITYNKQLNTFESYVFESEFCIRILNNASSTSCKNLTTSSPFTFIKADSDVSSVSVCDTQFNRPNRSTVNTNKN